jgi:glutaminase
VHLAENRDRAIEWCEERLLGRLGLTEPAGSVSIGENEFWSGLDARSVERLAVRARRRSATAGTRIVSAGDEATSVFLLVRGQVRVTIDLPDEEHARLATCSAGMAFGQMALVGDRMRTADVTADTDIEYFELPASEIEGLGESDPAFLGALYRNVARELAAQVRSANAEIRALST